ncbi:MAG TPA: DinB family protein [Bacillales bacterium]|nr:DinB family protein [Bacillales bacterium]
MYGIEAARKKVLAAVEGLTDEQMNVQVEQGRWTVAQVLEHLYLMERGVTGLIQQALADPKSVPASRKKPIENTVDRSYKVEAPGPFQPSDDFLSREKMLDKLQGSRDQLLAVVGSIDDQAVLTQKSFKHPVFGSMDLEQWIEFIGFHELRHLQQIEELTAKLS